MVVVVSTSQYPFELEQQYAAHFALFGFPLSPFQKHAIQALVEGNHVLITAHTGSGKTLPAEFAIQHFVRNQQKKVIYCSPIKALSNQKFYEFQQKYPDVSFGLLTGDNKINPSADVLIMTTEILLNTLFTLQGEQQVSLDGRPRNMDFAQLGVENAKSDTPLSSAIAHKVGVLDDRWCDIDVETELSCVVFDEVHYINDPHRGHVWEKCMMLLPPQIQMLMLSATIDKAHDFAQWVENIHKKATGFCLLDQSVPLSVPLNGRDLSAPCKKVILATTHVRVVPLSHYAFLTTTEATFKKIKDKQIQQEIKEAINKPLLLQDATGQFKETVFQNVVVKTINRLNNAQIDLKRKFVLNRLLEHLKSPDGSTGLDRFSSNTPLNGAEKDGLSPSPCASMRQDLDNQGKTMLPALLFLFSRKQVEICAREITARLLDDDSKIPYTVRAECDALLRSKLPNHHEYSSLPEYEFLVSLLEKGIGIHHSGMISVFREIVELFISKKYIHLLIATESFAIGLDCPIKTVIFTHFQKFDGSAERTLLSHEYTQMAGRAGRRGIDTVGHVIHCNNLFKPPSSLEYRQMLSGKPERFVSKFGITAQMILQQVVSSAAPLDTATPTPTPTPLEQVLAFIGGSLMNQDTQSQITQQNNLLENLRKEWVETQAALDANVDENTAALLRRFDDLEKQTEMANHKRLKEIAREKEVIQTTAGGKWPSQYNLWRKQQGLAQTIQKETEYGGELGRYTEQQVLQIGRVLERGGYLTPDSNTCWSLTEKGRLASQLKEVDGLLMSDLLLKTGYLSGWSAADIVSLLSCFCDVRSVGERSHDRMEEKVPEVILELEEQTATLEHWEHEYGVSLRGGEPVVLQTVLFYRMRDWIQATDKEACSQFLNNLLEECEIGAGDFVKVILKIMAMKKELERVVVSVPLQFVLSQIDELICKFVATSQSLYI